MSEEALIARVSSWLADAAIRRRFLRLGVTTDWSLHADSDGSLLMLPSGGPEPGVALVPVRGGYGILVADPEAPEELGPFPSLAAALAGLAAWLARRSGARVDDDGEEAGRSFE